MVNFCAVINCSNRADRNKDKSFYRLPSVITNEGEEMKKITEDCRRKWLENIKRSDIKPTNYQHTRVCSDHFIKGKPAHRRMVNDPDWAPTLNLGHSAGISSPCPERHERLKGRKQRQAQVEAARALLSLHDTNSTCEPDTNAENQPGGMTTQTDLDMKTVSALEEEVLNLTVEKLRLQETISAFEMKPESFEGENEKVLYLTGLPSYLILMTVFNFVSPFMTEIRRTSVTKFQQLLLVLMKLRLNLPNQYLAYKFSVSASTVSKIFLNVLDILFIRLKPLIHWPDRESLRKTMPLEFKKHFGNKVAVIIDCFEVFIERPSNLEARAQTWSSYKHHNTVKILIGITPQGVISFLSKAWGGRVSDKYLTENSGFLNKLTPGDVVLADRGFDIKDSVGLMCAEVKVPAFTKGRTQLSAFDVESTRKIAHVRIHVERVIGTVRQKYTILNSTLPIDFLKTDGEKFSTIDKIVTVSCALTNLCDSVIPVE